MLQAYSSRVRTIEEQAIRVKMTINASISLGTPLFSVQMTFSWYPIVQCADDFLTGRVWELFGVENRIKSVDDINKNVLYILIASAHYQLHDSVVSGVSCDITSFMTV